MGEKKPINIVLFFHKLQSDEAFSFAESIKKIPSDQGVVNLRLIRHDDKEVKDQLDDIQGIIFLYNDELAKDANLYEVIHTIEQKANLERFLLLYTHDQSLPKIFHAIRAQQHHMICCDEGSGSKCHEEFIDTFSKNLPKMAAFEVEKPAIPGLSFPERLSAAWRNVKFRRITGVFVIASLLGSVVFSLLPILRGSIERREGAYNPNIAVPQLQNFWLDNTFSPIGSQSFWVDSNFYKGKNSLSYGSSIKKEIYLFNVNADRMTDEAILTRHSVSSWPLSELKGFTTQVLATALADEKSTAKITFAMVLSEQTDYRFGCSLLPGASEASLECFIDEPAYQIIITAPQTLELNIPHIITVEFIPDTYVLRFFVDDVYFGQSAIQNVAYWRDRKVNAEIIVELQNMNTGTFSCQIQNYQLAKQD